MPNFVQPHDTHIGHVHLQVSNLIKARAFYIDLLGFKAVLLQGKLGETTLALSATGDVPIHLLLTERSNAKPKPSHTTGLYHLAVRLPDRKSLASTFQRLIAHNWPFQGFSDHIVSEALYLADPEGNGLELYRDRLPDQWQREGDQIAMRTDPLNVQDLLTEVEGENTPWTGINPKTDIGHIHLQVSDLTKAEAFYHDLLGLDITQRTYPGALFFSAGGYHHHIGTNIWASRGGSPPPEDAVGLVSYSMKLSDGEAWSTLVSRLRQAQVEIWKWIDYGDYLSALVRDPFGIGLELTVQRSQVEGDILDQLQV